MRGNDKIILMQNITFTNQPKLAEYDPSVSGSDGSFSVTSGLSKFSPQEYVHH